MNIVIFDKQSHQGADGMEIYTSRFSKYIKKLKHKVYVIRYTNKKTKQKDIYPLPYYLAEQRTIIVVPNEKTLNTIKQYLLTIKPDIVYAYIPLSPLDFFLPTLCHELNIPIIGIWHSDLNDSENAFSAIFKSVFLAYIPYVKRLDQLHVFTERLKKFYIKHGVAKNKIFVLPNGVDSAIYTPGISEFKEKNNIESAVLFLGRLTTQKNPEILIRSFLSVAAETQKLVLVGDGEMNRYLKKTYRDSRIIFTGAVVDEKKKIDIMRACNIFVLPSRIEGMSFALLEAMSCGLACITSDAGANSILLEKAGIVLRERDIHHELPLALKITLNHPQFAKELGKQARNKILKNYSQNKIHHKLLNKLKQTNKLYKKRVLR